MIPVALAGLAAAGQAAGAAAAATAAGTAAGAVGAGGLAAGAAGAAGTAASLGSSLTPAIDAAAAGNGLAGAGALANGGSAYMPSLTYQAATGNPVAGSVPLQQMKPLTLNGSNGTSRLNGILEDPRLKQAQEYMDKFGSGMSSGGGMMPAHSQQNQIGPPQLQRGPYIPFQPFQFDRRNYQFRRPGGY